MSWQLVMSYRNDPKSVKGKKIDRVKVKRVWGFARAYKKSLTLFLGSLLFSAVVGAIPPLLFRELIDRGLPSGTRQGDLGIITWLAIAGVIVAILTAALGILQRYYSAAIGEGLIYDLRVALFDHIQKQPLSFFTRTQTGALMSRLNNDVIGAQTAVTSTLGTVVSNVVTLAVTLTVMLRLEWRLTIVTLLVLPLFVIPARRVGSRLQSAAREAMELNSSMNATIVERFNVSGALIVKLFGRPKEEKESFAVRARRVADIGIQSALYSRTLFAALGLISAIGAAVVYYVGGRFAISGAISAGTIGAFIFYVGQVYDPLTQLTNARVDVLTALVSFDRVFEVLDFEPALKENEDPTEMETCKGRVDYNDVSFTHLPKELITLPSLEEVSTVARSSEEEEILSHISFSIEPGETVALVGPSGAGKTTTAMMLARIYDTTSGEVLLDGINVKNLSFESLKKHVSVVTQDPHLFHDSVAVNLRYAKPDATDEEMIDACKRAQIHDMIASLPDQYETLVGERGYRLSGGEKQRLAIARVLLMNPAVVILDEATSHLDSETEQLIQKAFDAALDQRTALVIAHRLSTIINADKIIVLEKGHIVETGTHTELIAAGGLYSDLYTTQYVE
ncbi:MAG TPA: ABC transporter ATP-binding protein [Acidimicrobiia bacterium]|nr:ABC transporter ATP-binding protein [Acidimicrobiia bacterium]